MGATVETVQVGQNAEHTGADAARLSSPKTAVLAGVAGIVRRWKAAPCLTIRGLTREEHQALSVLAATAGVRSREDYVRRLIRCALPDKHRGADAAPFAGEHRGADATRLAESGQPIQDLLGAGVVARD